MSVSRLQKVPLREIWPHEARDFTTWLAVNLDFLSEVIGFDLNLVEREAAAGPFSADILAEDSRGNFVVIENQLERTNHDHLGKMITYLSNLDAKTAIWITSDPRPEHETAIHWLNETLPADTAFFLMKLEAFSIDDSSPAPLLSIIAGPSPEGKQVGAQKKDLAERHVFRLEFWEQLLDKARERTPQFSNISPSKENYINTSAGTSGFAYAFVVRLNDAQVELYIDRGDREKNKRLYDALLSRKDDIEQAFGESLDWQRLDDRRACRIRSVISDHGLVDRNEWSLLQDKMISRMDRFSQVMQPEIQLLDL